MICFADGCGRSPVWPPACCHACLMRAGLHAPACLVWPGGICRGFDALPSPWRHSGDISSCDRAWWPGVRQTLNRHPRTLRESGRVGRVDPPQRVGQAFVCCGFAVGLPRTHRRQTVGADGQCLRGRAGSSMRFGHSLRARYRDRGKCLGLRTWIILASAVPRVHVEERRESVSPRSARASADKCGQLLTSLVCLGFWVYPHDFFCPTRASRRH